MRDHGQNVTIYPKFDFKKATIGVKVNAQDLQGPTHIHPHTKFVKGQHKMEISEEDITLFHLVTEFHLEAGSKVNSLHKIPSQ